MDRFEKQFKKQLKGLGISLTEIESFLKKHSEICPFCEDYEWDESTELAANHLEAYPDTCLKSFKEKKEKTKVEE